MEINSEIRARLPVWRQKLLNILEEVEQERKSKKRKIQIKTTEVRPSQRRNMIVNEVSEKPGYNGFSNNACRRNIKNAKKLLKSKGRISDFLGHHNEGEEKILNDNSSSSSKEGH